MSLPATETLTYSVAKCGTRWCVYAIRPPRYPRGEPIRVVVARRATELQAQMAMADCQERDNFVADVIRKAVR